MAKKKKKRKKHKPSINSRAKGAGGERELSRELSMLFGVEAYRGRQFHGREDAPDVVMDIPGVHFECKRTESLSVYKALEQSEWDAGKDQIPLVAHRRNHKRWLLCMFLDDVPELVNLLRSFVKEKSDEGC